jgi:tetratricopeptide (TPR) repeat protein
MKKVVFLFGLLLFPNYCFASEELSKQAVAFYSDNNSNQAMDLLLQIEEKKRTPQDWLLLGNLLEENGEKENAIYMYQKAIAVNNKYYKSYYNLANIFLEEEKYGLAIEHYKKAISLNKNNPYLHYNLACAYIKSGNIKKAKTSLITAVTLKNDIPEVHYNLAYVYKSLGKEKVAQSYLENYNKLIGENY